MKYLLESKIYWRYRDVVELAKKNVRQARKIVKKDKEGIEELLHQGVNEIKIRGLAETDQELLAALYILVYREDRDKKIDGKTNREFIEEVSKKILMKLSKIWTFLKKT